MMVIKGNRVIRHEGINLIFGFTLAEVLITLAIIGVVSALVIPTVIKNYNDKKYNTARLKALKTFGEAGKLASINDEMNSQSNATDFVNNVLSKYLKIVKVCDNAPDCGFPSQIQPNNTSVAKKNVTALRKWNQIGGNKSNASSPTNDTAMSVVILTNDGFSALVHYNPKCARNSREISISSNCTNIECPSYAVDQACMNVIYDMNGVKGPNHVGEDIGFVTTFWSGLKATSVAPGILPYNTAQTIYDEGLKNWTNSQKLCQEKGINKIPYTLGSLEELQSVAVNNQLSSLPNHYYWSGSPVADIPVIAWRVNYYGDRTYLNSADISGVWCLRR